MNLDLAIQNTLKRSPMEGAMHGVLSNFGAQYELRSYTENAGLADQLFGDKVAVTAPVGDEQLSKAVLPDDATFAPPAQASFSQTFNFFEYIIWHYSKSNFKFWSCFFCSCCFLKIKCFYFFGMFYD